MKIKAKYNGTCRGCGGQIIAGTKIDWTRSGGAYHTGCKPTGRGGRATRADHEYWQGAADASRYLSDKALYGEELANQWDLEREMREEW